VGIRYPFAYTEFTSLYVVRQVFWAKKIPVGAYGTNNRSTTGIRRYAPNSRTKGDKRPVLCCLTNNVIISSPVGECKSHCWLFDKDEVNDRVLQLGAENVLHVVLGETGNATADPRQTYRVAKL
jgi:hypothetical protein